MDMTKLKADITKLALEELARANEQFPQFHSLHEGFSVLHEELDEADDERERVMEGMAQLWSHIKKNDEIPIPSDIAGVQLYLRNNIAESIQALAMTIKMFAVLDGDINE